MRPNIIFGLLLTLARSAPRRDWRARIDWDAMEHSLEEGDDPELLVSEDALLIREMERRRAAALEPPEGGVPQRGEGDWMRHTAAHGGPTMLFAELRPGAWSAAELAALSDEWMELLKTAGIEATVYEVSPGRLLVTLQTGWRGYEVREFLLRQAVVAEVSWNQHTYKSEEEEEEQHMGAKKPHSKRKRAQRRHATP